MSHWQTALRPVLDSHMSPRHEPGDRGPVVVVVSESPGSVAALQRAAAEAAMCSMHLHVVDATASGRFKETLS